MDAWGYVQVYAVIVGGPDAEDAAGTWVQRPFRHPRGDKRGQPYEYSLLCSRRTSLRTHLARA